MTDSVSKACWDAENTVQIKLKLNRRTDADIIALLDTVDNKQGLIKNLLRGYLLLMKLI